ncbi:hypothetical protein SmJEL517_g05062 [Synchytrium microbalum]|uniref:Inositol hexakisphosphate-domain-containing protein n=1 Tax=Synchytrium microbalum TaxID=1806994 RepID=A0A507BRB5_9FUNG|nr:uncharacterized protein SmJEL517_g05062 [Synchytrium microbalum]TPX31687.1 hypothetical protein SmJEL517_g05062 [Synchytrium microbalum]
MSREGSQSPPRKSLIASSAMYSANGSPTPGSASSDRIQALTTSSSRPSSVFETRNVISPRQLAKHAVVKNTRELLSSISTVTKNRTGSVLGRQLILKSDHFDTALNTQLEFYLQGAPNFRFTDLNIYGVAQPTVSGVSTVLTLLNCHPTGDPTASAIWFSAREEPLVYIARKPFVLREEESPLQNIKSYQGISISRLEQMEVRLKEDVIREATKYNQMILVHDELDNGRVVPSWMSADIVQTPREVFNSFCEYGYRVQYIRIPVSPEQAPEDRYLDEYVNAIKNSKTSEALVFNCGMGVGRTTFAMVMATLVRRGQHLAEGKEDPVPIGGVTLKGGSDGSSDLLVDNDDFQKTRAVLKLMYILERGLEGKIGMRSTVDRVLARPAVIDDLKNAVLGNYQVVLQLASVLQQGARTKRVLDEVVNQCDVMINLREVILMHRVAYASTGDPVMLEKALGCLERYFFLLAFASYVNENSSDGFQTPFSIWLGARPEIFRMLEGMRRKGPRLYLFRPVEDLGVLSESVTPSSKLLRTSTHQGGERTQENEAEKYVIKSRQGTVLVPNTILKMDFWSSSSSSTNVIEGAANFRRIATQNIYGVAQPTVHGMENVMANLKQTDPSLTAVIWLNLREEPLVYCNGIPYVLRDRYLTLRNIRSYSGITGERLELMEVRLKQDVLQELDNYDNRILLHAETPDAQVVPVWEDCTAEHVQTLREVIDELKHEGHPLEYNRVPMTAETAPDESDLDTLLQLLTRRATRTSAIVVNCQIGQGRSTVGTAVASLVMHWLNNTKPSHYDAMPPNAKPRINYQIIHSLLRVIRNGLECKNMVDSVIDDCGQFMNIRDSIEQCRLQAENESDKDLKKRAVRRGLLNLKRYFILILFQCYLDQNRLDHVTQRNESFKLWMDRHPEFATIREDFENADIQALVPVEKLAPGDGVALTNEVLKVVNSRNGQVLAQQTILKHDMFPGCQKLSLSERIEGSPNFRCISLSTVKSLATFGNSVIGSPNPATTPIASSFHASAMMGSSITALNAPMLDKAGEGPFVYGVAMPTKDAIRRVLSRIDAGPGGSRYLLWTCLREEPVLYVNGRPYVLRLFQEPLKNLEATGISRLRVERMEHQMKLDAIADSRRYGGRLLLHEEEGDAKTYSIVPVWETVKEQDIQTPMEVFKSIENEGFHVNYLRIPITDEQAPIPNVFDEMVERLMGVQGNTDAMFNCQMGRGRTTTGTVIACLMEMIVGNDKVLLNASYIDEADMMSESIDKSDTSAGGLSPSMKRYQNGEYKMVLQLIGVLAYGKLSKRLTDKALDACDHIQNLRVAILDYKLRVEALDPKSPKYAQLRDVGLNYLVRYFFLLCFADYLLEEATQVDRTLATQTRPSALFDHDDEEDDDDLEEEDEDHTGSAMTSAGYWNITGNNNNGSRGDTPQPGKAPPIDMASSFEEHFRSQERLSVAINPLTRPRITFSEWLRERREILNIVRKHNQTLD